MNDEKVSYHIEKQEAGRDIYQAGRDIIIQHPITKEPVNIPSIQSVLRKGEISEGEYFRKEPAWVDYEQDFIVEREEVNEIIKSLEKDKVQLIVGAPASGKSIILKNVGYKLANDGREVHFVELKKHPADEIKLFFENIPKIDYESIFIVDDVHLYLSECERLIKNFKGKGKLIIGSRETREITEEHPREPDEYELLSELSKTCIHVQADDVTERMIRTFLEKQYHFDEYRIKTLSRNLDKYKKDLWLLSWSLIAFNKNKMSVDIDDIYKKIATSIEKIKIGKDKEPINAEDVFLPMSILYRFEIPIERYFLEEQLGIEKNIINLLIRLQEIAETKEAGHKMLSLQHSSLAELYFGAYLREPDLGRKIQKNILKGRDKKDLEYCLFYKYLTTADLINTLHVVEQLGAFWLDYMGEEKGGETLLIKLIENDKIRKTVINRLDDEKDIGKVGSCASAIYFASKDVAMKLVDSIEIDALSSKLDIEEDIKNVWLLLGGILLANAKVAMKLLENININTLSLKIAKEEDIEKIGLCMSIIAFANIKVAYKLLDGINIRALALKIDNEKYITKAESCVRGIAVANEEVALKLVENINIETLSLKIDKEDDIHNVVSCVSAIEQANIEVALKLLDIIDINALSLKIDKEKDIRNIDSMIINIGHLNKEVANEIVNRLSPITRGELQAYRDRP